MDSTRTRINELVGLKKQRKLTTRENYELQRLLEKHSRLSR